MGVVMVRMTFLVVYFEGKHLAGYFVLLMVYLKVECLVCLSGFLMFSLKVKNLALCLVPKMGYSIESRLDLNLVSYLDDERD